MRTHLRKWGNSLALRVARAHAGDLGWDDGTPVDMVVDRGELRVRPVTGQSPRLADLVSEISAYNMHQSPPVDGARPPERGDLVWLDGPDPATRRPALVLSAGIYNVRTGQAVICPVATRIKGYPFEVVLKVGGRTVGAVLADHVETVDWTKTRFERIDEAPAGVVREVAARLAALIGLADRSEAGV